MMAAQAASFLALYSILEPRKVGVNPHWCELISVGTCLSLTLN